MMTVWRKSRKYMPGVARNSASRLRRLVLQKVHSVDSVKIVVRYQLESGVFVVFEETKRGV
jgi:hypothetical protein